MTLPLHYWPVSSGDYPLLSSAIPLIVCYMPFGNFLLVADDFIGVSPFSLELDV